MSSEESVIDTHSLKISAPDFFMISSGFTTLPKLFDIFLPSPSSTNPCVITALKGEIDYENPSKIYLTKVKALIRLKNSENVTITSEYGKYNSENYDTIFSKNVKINYLDHKITGEYLDFSLERNLMLISKKVIYSNLDNILKADVIEVDIKTKNTKIFMYEKDKKIRIKNKDQNGNN